MGLPVVKREFRGISRRAQRLLKLPEGVNVDFKRDLSGIKGRSLVSFANSSQGGAILIGVDEFTHADGVQRGQVVGCPVDDSARMGIINKATGCIPSVEIEIFVENLSSCPFLRIEIPSGRNKPYSTPRGEYTVRADGRGRAMFPEELLNIFMDREGEQFISRFRNAVYQLENKIGFINEALNDGLDRVGGHISGLDQQIQNTLENMESSTRSLEQNSVELLQVLREANQYIEQLRQLVTQNDSHENAEAVVRLQQTVKLLARLLKRNARKTDT